MGIRTKKFCLLEDSGYYRNVHVIFFLGWTSFVASYIMDIYIYTGILCGLFIELIFYITVFGLKISLFANSMKDGNIHVQ